jgi:transcriptional regulator with XRE-family HTH domain
MATQNNRSPTVRRRRLARLLRDFREAAGITAAEAAKSVRRSQSWLSRTERALNPAPEGPVLLHLLALYGVTGQEAENLAVIAEESNEKGWWHTYRDNVTDDYATFIGLEDAAEAIRSFEPAYIPGLLQTEEYARTVIAGGPIPFDHDQVEARIRVLMGRRKLLTREHPLKLWAVIDETVLHRTIGGIDVMREQLLHLAGCAQVPGVAVQVLPFTSGMHPAMSGAFHVIRFPGSDDPDAGYADTPLGTIYADEPYDVDRLKRAFQNLSELALSHHASMEAVAKAAASM